MHILLYHLHHCVIFYHIIYCIRMMPYMFPCSRLHERFFVHRDAWWVDTADRTFLFWWTVSTYYLLRCFFYIPCHLPNQPTPSLILLVLIISTQLDNCVIVIRLKFQLMGCNGFKTLCKMSPLNSRWFQIRCSWDDDAHWTASYFFTGLVETTTTTTNNQQPTTNKQQTRNKKQETTNNKQQTTNSKQQTAKVAAAAARHTVMGQ